ncbi:uncharacterized protein N7483_002753 [Penicillium malachiteum]|uniref:uncharacterized protein n=1 Tax=Penicillium malachiteum TaxID=1324776 RepID=UPI002547BAD3|nr:uncharacterized protein N7483_002753 [Penicillium malachiteum]KAJ5737628.1 hypothetical protein N7483_002753 [Penicillium malachiteum]
MLDSIINTTLLDDVMKEDPTTNSFQDFIATLSGHEDSLLVMSGTMGNRVALRTALLAPPYSVLLVPSNGHHLTLKDVEKHANLRDDVYDYPTRIISLENTLSGTIMPMEDTREISSWARSQTPPIHMQLDGARLWEAVNAGAGTLKEYTSCFDSVSLCFTKGLGAPIGSIVIGNLAFIKRARWMRKILGGGIRASGILCAPARVAVEQVFLGGRLRQSQDTPQQFSKLWLSLGRKLQHPTETNMVWLDLEPTGIDEERFADLAENAGVKTTRGHLQGRVVFHYQICDRALDALVNLFVELLKSKRSVFWE